MEGRATLTIEVSSMTTNCAETSSPSPTMRRRRSFGQALDSALGLGRCGAGYGAFSRRVPGVR